MNRMDSNLRGTASRRGPRRPSWLDRGLLVAVLGVQVAILALLLQQRREPDVKGPTPPGPSRVSASITEPAAGSFEDLAAHSGGRAPFPPAADPLRGMMDRMVESARMDLERMRRWVDLDRGWESLLSSPAMDMREDRGAYIVLFSLPGTRPTDIAINMEGRILTLRAPVHGSYGRRGVGLAFERRVRVPGPVRAADASAAMTNGVLRVVLPKGGEADTQVCRIRLL